MIKNITPAQLDGYSDIKVPFMINQLLKDNVFPKLRLIQQQELLRIERICNRKRYITEVKSDYVKMLYITFIKNKFEFKDKYIPKTIIIQSQPQHRGLQIFNQLNS